MHPTILRRIPGFTLIELLTVIAIIGILAAILIPTVGRVRESAQVSKQISNLRQIGQAMVLFANENRNRLPLRDGNVFRMPNGTDRNISWSEAVNNYMIVRGERNSAFLYRENPIWESPFASKLTEASWAHFGMSVWVQQPQWQQRLDVVPAPSRLVIVGEVNHTGSNALDPRVAPQTNREVQTVFRTSLPGGRTTLLWADFHVSTERGAEITFDLKPEMWRWW